MGGGERQATPRVLDEHSMGCLKEKGGDELGWGLVIVWIFNAPQRSMC